MQNMDTNEFVVLDTQCSSYSKQAEKMAQAKRANIVDILRQAEFLKLYGGPLKNKNQKRSLRVHENGQISYWNGNSMRGTIELDSTSTVGLH